MYMAWRRKTDGSIRDRVLSCLQSEGLLDTYSKDIPVSPETSESRHFMDSDNTVNIVNHTEALVNNCCRLTNSKNVIQSCHRSICGKTKCGSSRHMNSKLVKNCSIERNCHRLLAPRNRRQNNTNFIYVRHKPSVTSYALKGTYYCVFCEAL